MITVEMQYSWTQDSKSCRPGNARRSSASARVPNADVDAAALHVARKGRKVVLRCAPDLTASAPCATAIPLSAAALLPAGAARAGAAAACCERLGRLCQHARHAVVAAPRGPGQHHSVAAVQQQRGGRRVPGVAPHEEDGVAAQAEGDQGLVQAGLGIVDVPVQGVACTGQPGREASAGRGWAGQGSVHCSRMGATTAGVQGKEKACC